MTGRPRILTVLEHYLPGVKAGGPVRSLQDLVASLGDDFQFDILTADRDLGDDEPYTGILLRTWYPCGKARVRYLRPKERTFRGWRRVLQGERAHVLYLNSLFARSTIRILLLRRLGLVPKVPVILAPRGELQAGALAIKPRRKNAWLLAAAWLGLFNGSVWQAASREEEEQILAGLGRRVAVRVAPHLSPPVEAPTEGGQGDDARGKSPGALRVAFVSRISPMKNLDYALAVLGGVSGTVHFDIYGPVEDERYWDSCRRLIEAMPRSVTVRYRGSLAPSEVPRVLSGYHLFFLPTRGESYGHVVIEALAAGCPVLLSDRTRWHQVTEEGAGWEIPLERPDVFAERVEALVAMNGPALARLSASARACALRCVDDGGARAAAARLFTDAAHGTHGVTA